MKRPRRAALLQRVRPALFGVQRSSAGLTNRSRAGRSERFSQRNPSRTKLGTRPQHPQVRRSEPLGVLFEVGVRFGERRRERRVMLSGGVGVVWIISARLRSRSASAAAALSWASVSAISASTPPMLRKRR